MVVSQSETVQRLSGTIHLIESCPNMISLISLEAKQMGARSAGNPHATCDEEGTGNVGIFPTRQSSTLPVRGGRGNPSRLLDINYTGDTDV
jgi:hypothetical protein